MRGSIWIKRPKYRDEIQYKKDEETVMKKEVDKVDNYIGVPVTGYGMRKVWGIKCANCNLPQLFLDGEDAPIVCDDCGSTLPEE